MVIVDYILCFEQCMQSCNKILQFICLRIWYSWHCFECFVRFELPLEMLLKILLVVQTDGGLPIVYYLLLLVFIAINVYYGTVGGCRYCECLENNSGLIVMCRYCECFAAGVYCFEPCACQGCFNKPIRTTVAALRAVHN